MESEDVSAPVTFYREGHCFEKMRVSQQLCSAQYKLV